MADIKDRVAEYLSSFLDKELSEIAVNVHKDFLDKRAEKDKAREKAGRDLVKSNAASIKTSAASDAATIDRAAGEGGVTVAQGGMNSKMRHNLNRAAWKRHHALTGGKDYKSGREAQGQHSGRVGTGATAALKAAATSFDKKRVLDLQARAPESDREPAPASGAPTGVAAKGTTVAQDILAKVDSLKAARSAKPKSPGRESRKGTVLAKNILADLRAGKYPTSSENELVDLGKQMAAEKRPTNITDKPEYHEPKPQTYKR